MLLSALPVDSYVQFSGKWGPRMATGAFCFIHMPGLLCPAMIGESTIQVLAAHSSDPTWPSDM
jgi:hypothetical protein